jgi:urease accessory protein UreF
MLYSDSFQEMKIVFQIWLSLICHGVVRAIKHHQAAVQGLLIRCRITANANAKYQAESLEIWLHMP